MTGRGLSRIVERIRAAHLFAAGDAVLVGVSGGGDSVALLVALRALAPAMGLRLVVGHVDHGLRPEAADDARFVRDLSGQWGLPYVEERVTVVTGAGRSPEAAARAARYAALERLALAQGCGKVAVGHTADDQAETLLLRLLGGGRLAGMRATRPLGRVELVRPLLGVWRREARAVLREQGVGWREDPTNVDRRFLRNRIRHDLLPLLEGHIPGVRRRLRDAAEWLAEEDALLDRLAREAEARVLRLGAGVVALRRAALQAEPPALQRRLVRRAVRRAGGNTRRLRGVHISGVLRLAQEGREGRQVNLPGVVAAVVGGEIHLRRPEPPEGGTAVAAGQGVAVGTVTGKRKGDGAPSPGGAGC